MTTKPAMTIDEKILDDATVSRLRKAKGYIDAASKRVDCAKAELKTARSEHDMAEETLLKMIDKLNQPELRFTEPTLLPPGENLGKKAGKKIPIKGSTSER